MKNQGQDVWKNQVGLTLVEILITLAVMGILASVAMPAVQAMVQKNRQLAFTNEIVSSLHLARNEAAKQIHNVVMCAANEQQTNCDVDATDYSNGWLVFVDYDDNQQVAASSVFFDTTGDGIGDASEQILYVSEPAYRAFYNVAANRSTAERYIVYQANGQTRIKAFSLLVSERSSQKTVARVYFSLSGRMRACTVKTGDSC